MSDPETDDRDLAAEAGVAPGRTTSNPITGETVTFRRTSGRSPADEIEFDLELRPIGAPGGMPHRHLPAERFEVSDGMLYAFVAGQGLVRTGPGETLEIPKRRWHVLFAFRRTRARVTIRPGIRFDELIARGAALARGDLRPSNLRRINDLLSEHDCIPRLPSRYPSRPPAR